MKKSLRYLAATAAVAVTAAAFAVPAFEVAPIVPEKSAMPAYPGLKGKQRPLRDAASKAEVTLPSFRAPMLAPESEAGRMRAFLVYADTWSSSGTWEFGLYEWPASGAYGRKPVALSSDMDCTGGAAYIGNGRYFQTYHFSLYGSTYVYHRIIDANDGWSIAETYGKEYDLARDMAWDHTTSTLYGIFRSDDLEGYVLGTIDPDNSGEGRSVVAPLAEVWEAIAFDHNGTLYALGRSGMIYMVDKFTGATTEVGNSGLTTKYQSSGAIDPQSGKMYFLPVDESAQNLYAIDLATAKAEPVYVMSDGEQLAGMHFTEATPAAGAPAAAGSPKAEFDHSTLAGTVGFTAPAKTVGGAALSGQLEWTVSAGGRVLATGNAAPGQKVSAELTLPSPGLYTFCITTAAASLCSPEAWATAYVGTDSPRAVTGVELTADGNTFTLSWEPAAEAAHGGQFDPAAVTYSVTRYPEGKTVAEGLTSTTFSETLTEGSEPVSVAYAVTPVHKGMSGAATRSNSVLFGAIRPPYSADFTSADDMASITLLDANNDGRFWRDYTDDNDAPCIYLYPTSMAPGDDYIFSAPLRLEPGHLYKTVFSLGARYAKYGNTELVDIVVADSPTVDGISQTILSKATVTEEAQDVEATFTVAETGNYRVALHACSEPDSWGLYAYGMSVAVQSSDKAPAAPVATAVAAGKTVTVTVTAPATSINGEPVGALTRIDLRRGSTLLKSFSPVAAGETLTYEDTDLDDGLHVYTATAVNGDGDGLPGEARAFVGINVPGRPLNLTAKLLDDSRTVRLTWDAPEVDADGCAISPEVVEYVVATYDDSQRKWLELRSGIADTQFEYTHRVADGEQTLVRYGVFARTSAGTNEQDFAVAPTVAIGDAYTMPYIETFAGPTLAGVLGEENENESASWEIVYTKDQDGTGGCLFYTGAIDKQGALFTGRIRITGENPVMSFWFWSIPKSPDNQGITVEVNDGSGYKAVETFPLNQGGTEQHWVRGLVKLDEYVGKELQFRFCYTTRMHVLYIDNIRVVNSFDHNLTACSIAASSQVLPGRAFSVVAEIENGGELPTDACSVTLLQNGEELQSVRLQPLEPATRANVTFNVELSSLDPEDNLFQARIDYDADELDSDNLTAELPVRLIHADVPRVTDLAAHASADGTGTLTWSQPDAGAERETVTDDFERCIPFSIGQPTSAIDNDFIGDWTMVNADRSGSNGLAGFIHPNIAAGSDLSFIVFNPSELGIIVQGWQPRSGKNAMVCFCAPDGANDDWMVSPRLSGRAQTISFYARSTSESYIEAFEVLSTAGAPAETGNFTRVSRVDRVPAEWTRYEAALPEGTTHFAIRCVSDRQIALFVDDVTFERANPNFAVAPSAYNVFRNGLLTATTPTTSAAVAESDPEATYRVTAVYGRGESQASNAVRFDRTSVGATPADAVTIAAGRGVIDIRGAEGLTVTVATVDGRLASRTAAAPADLRVALAPGVYIVRAGATTAKVVVR